MQFFYLDIQNKRKKKYQPEACGAPDEIRNSMFQQNDIFSIILINQVEERLLFHQQRLHNVQLFVMMSGRRLYI